MNGVRRLVDDLVDKHLWPVALLLVIALVAIPLLIGGGSAQPGDTALATPLDAGPVASATPAVELAGPPAVRSRPGKVRDPFRRTKTKAAKSESSSGSAAKSTSKGSASKADATTGGAGSGSSSGSGSGSGKVKRTPATSASPSPRRLPSLAARSVYETVARFTGPGKDYEHPLERLSAFGDDDSPALLYLGVSRGGEYAIFLLGPDATAGGDDGACIVADSCRAIGLRKGDKLEVEVARPDAESRRYKLEITSLRRVARSSEAAAKRERNHVAEGGRDVLHTLAKDVPTAGALSQLRYGPVTGTVALVRAP